MRRAGTAFLWLLSLAAAAPGCGGDKTDERPSAPAPTPAPAPVAPAIDAAPAGPRHAPISQALWDELVPLPAGARLISPLAGQGEGERMQAGYCFEKMSAKKVGTTLRKALEGAGWQAVTVNLAAKTRGSVTASRPPYRFAATVRRIESPTCSAKAGHTLVSILVHRIGPPPPPAP